MAGKGDKGYTVRERRIEDYSQDPLNHNKGSEFGGHLLEKSIQVNGLGRGIQVSADDVIIAGNKTQAKARELGRTKVLEVETDGNTLVVVKRKDIQSGTKRFYDAAMADNLVQKHSFVEDAQVTEAIAEQYLVEPYSWGASDDQLHKEQISGSGLKSLGVGVRDHESDDDPENDVPVNSPVSREEKLYPITAMVNRSTLAKWEQFKQLHGIKKDTDAILKLLESTPL